MSVKLIYVLLSVKIIYNSKLCIMNSPLDTYKVLKSHKSSTFNLVKWHFEDILKSIKRKLTLKRKYSDPFTCNVSRDIHHDTFYQVFRCIRDYVPSIAVYTEVKRNKKKVTGYNIKFEHIGPFTFHLSQLAEELKDTVSSEFLRKTFACGSRAKVVATKDKPLVINYKCSTNVMTMICHFETKNSYGNVTSY